MPNNKNSLDIFGNFAWGIYIWFDISISDNGLIGLIIFF